MQQEKKKWEQTKVFRAKSQTSYISSQTSDLIYTETVTIKDDKVEDKQKPLPDYYGNFDLEAFFTDPIDDWIIEPMIEEIDEDNTENSTLHLT